MKVLKYGGNMYVILVYDISTDDDGGRISRNIFKICKRYLTNVQKSVFEGEITPVLLRKLYLELRGFIRNDKDSVLLFKSRQEKWLEKEFWGLEDDKTSNFF